MRNNIYGNSEKRATGDTADAKRNPPAGGVTADAKRNPPVGGAAADAKRNPSAGGAAADAKRNPSAGGAAAEAKRKPPAGGLAADAKRSPAAGTVTDAKRNPPADGGPQEGDMRCYADRLLAWYKRSKRDLPWRRSKNPYHIWVSEIMLQQTRVDTVIPYFHRFIDRFPSVAALADAPEEDVLKAWEGLGYYSRARNLQAAVREVRDAYGGIVPSDKEDVTSLKGVGPYTAGAILSIAYNVPEPAVDGNVMRVLSRFFVLEDDIAKPGTRVKIERLAKMLIPDGEAGDFNQALMELGATVCTPRSPQCLTCPVMERCGARLAGRADELPVKTKAKPPRPERRAAAFVLRADGRLLVRRRPDDGLLARMWELPHIPLPANAAAGDEAADAAALGEALAAADGLRVEPLGILADETHTFSHIHWEMRVFRSRLAPDMPEGLPPRYRWLSKDELGLHAFPNLFLRILRDHWQAE